MNMNRSNYVSKALNSKDLLEMVQELNSKTGTYGNLKVYLNDEQFFNEQFTEPYKAIMAINLGGHFNLMDDYVLFDRKKVKSLSASEYEDLIKNEVSEIVKDYLSFLGKGEVNEKQNLIEEILKDMEETKPVYSFVYQEYELIKNEEQKYYFEVIDKTKEGIVIQLYKTDVEDFHNVETSTKEIPVYVDYERDKYYAYEYVEFEGYKIYADKFYNPYEN